MNTLNNLTLDNLKEAVQNLKVLRSFEEFKQIPVNHCCVILPDNDFVTYNEQNRGGDTVKSKITNFIKDANSDLFDWQLAKFSIDTNGMIVEGTHKTMALLNDGFPIIGQKCYPKEPEVISYVNTRINSKWSGKQIFTTSRMCENLGVLIADKKRDNILKKYSLKSEQISFSQIYGLAFEDVKYFSGGVNTPTMYDYNDPLFLRKVKSKKFDNALDLFAKLTKLLERKEINRGYKAIKEMFKLHFERTEWFYLDIATNIIEIRLNNSKGNNIPFTDDSMKAIRKDIKDLFGVEI